VTDDYRPTLLDREGPADPGKALGELRRLIDRDPTSDAATHARKALVNLKREMAIDG
jgi:hypothetical protein